MFCAVILCGLVAGSNRRLNFGLYIATSGRGSILRKSFGAKLNWLPVSLLLVTGLAASY